ncbi:MAG: putative Zn-dependent protease [Granulosicoccus sp.]|jgi:predicted Zn-dependent protease
MDFATGECSMNLVVKLPALGLGLAAAVLLSACVQNLVTGKKDFLLVSQDWELKIGAKQYLPLRQSQGGDYVVDPGVERYVQSVGNRLAAKSDRKLPYEFHVINDSTPNAWALPGGKISINRGLLVELKTEAELAAVLGHEIVHSAAKHGAKGQTRGIGLQLGVLTASVIGARQGYGQEVQLLSSVGAQIINSQYGQGAELESDHYGMNYMSRAGFDPQGAVELQRTFVALSKGQQSNPLSRLFASHPPSQKRVDENIKTAQGLKKGGIVGEDSYKKAMARLFKTQKAYDAYDKAHAAFKKNDIKQASSLLKTAIRIEPKEAHFYSLQGDIAMAQNNMSTAKRFYSNAISLNSQFYRNYLQRGKVNEKQNNSKAAQADYATSLKLLPTTAAQLALGQFAENDDKLQVARRYYTMAAQTSGADAEKAQGALMRLDPPTSIDTRLLVRQGVNRNGNFVIELINQTSRSIGNVKLGLRSRANGPQQVQTVRKTIAPGRRHIIDTGAKMTKLRAEKINVVVLNADFVR